MFQTDNTIDKTNYRPDSRPSIFTPIVHMELRDEMDVSYASEMIASHAKMMGENIHVMGASGRIEA